MCTMLLGYHTALLASSALPSAHQLALSIIFQQYCKRRETSSAVQLLLLTGSTAKLTAALLQQLRTHIAAGLLQQVITTLPDVQQCDESVTVLLQSITSLAKVATPEQLQVLLKGRNPQHILTASCSSTAAATAAARLLLVAVNKGLPMCRILAGGTTYKAQTWAATAMQPLLEQMKQHIVACWGSAATDLPSEMQQFWQLLCIVIRVAHAATPAIPLHALQSFFSIPAISAATQAALLSACPNIQSATVQMVTTLAALSASLAQCCFHMVAPIVTQVMQPPQFSRAHYFIDGEYIEAAASGEDHTNAVSQMWGHILYRMSNRSLLEAEIIKQLPATAVAVASAAPMVAALAASHHRTVVRCPCSEGVQLSITEVHKEGIARYFTDDVVIVTALFLEVASSFYQCYTKPLLADKPEVVTAALMAHLDTFVQIVTAAPAALAAASKCSRAVIESHPAPLCRLESVVLLTVWMLHSLVSALSCDSSKPCYSSWAGGVPAISELLTQKLATITHSKTYVHIQTVGLQLARSLLTSYFSAVPDPASASAHSGWDTLLQAVVALLAGTTLPVFCFAKRSLICTACHLVQDIAGCMPQLLLLPAQRDSGCSSSPAAGKTAKQSVSSTADNVVQLLTCHLQAIHAGLRARKLVRSFSGQELLDAVEGTLAALQQVPGMICCQG